MSNSDRSGWSCCTSLYPQQLVLRSSSIQLIPILPRPYPETYWRRVAASGCGFTSCTRAPTATSIRPLQPWPNCEFGGLVIGADPFLTGRMELLAALALRHALPAIFQYHDYAAAGGLVSYGGSVTNFRTKPGSTPVGFSEAKSRRSCRSCRRRKLS